MEAAAARLARLAAAARAPARGGALVAAGAPFGALSPRHFAGSVAAGVVANVVRAAQVRGAAAAPLTCSVGAGAPAAAQPPPALPAQGRSVCPRRTVRPSAKAAATLRQSSTGAVPAAAQRHPLPDAALGAVPATPGERHTGLGRVPRHVGPGRVPRRARQSAGPERRAGLGYPNPARGRAGRGAGRAAGGRALPAGLRGRARGRRARRPAGRAGRAAGAPRLPGGGAPAL